jgi:ketosteroid isomerase-like protein
MPHPRTVSMAIAILLLGVSAVRADTKEEILVLLERFVAAQNAHDSAAVKSMLADSAEFLWITRGTPIWGRDAAIKRFEALYQGTWKLEPAMGELKVMDLANGAAQLFVPITFTIGPAGQPPQTTRFLMNQTLIRTAQGWLIASILPIPVPSS